MSAIAPVNVPPSPAATPPEKPGKPDHEGLSFGDIVDIINPLQHIPVVNAIYRRITHDDMSPTAEIFGGALFGGIVGAVTSVANVLFAQATGKDFGGTVLAWLGFGEEPPTQLAEVPPEPAPAEPNSPTLAETASVPAPLPSAREGDTASVPGLGPLVEALDRQKVDPSIAARAIFAYRTAIGLQQVKDDPSAGY